VLDSPRMAELVGQAAQDSEVAELLAEHDRHKLKLGDLVDDYASGLLSREELARAKGVVEAAMERNRARLDKLQSGRALASVPVGQGIREAWRAADVEWQVALVHLLVERVVVHPGYPGGRRWPEDGSELLKRVGRQWRFNPARVEIHWKTEAPRAC
jgi:site-specific DNA recombinase